MLFCDEANEKFQSAECNIDKVRELVQTQPPIRRISIRLANTETTFPTRQPPLVAYRYNYKYPKHPFVPSQCKVFKHDCVLFPFDPSEVSKLQKDVFSSNTVRVGELKRITSLKQLQRYHTIQAPIAIHNYEGNLYYRTDVYEDLKQGKGLDLSFVLTSTDDNGRIQ